MSTQFKFCFGRSPLEEVTRLFHTFYSALALSAPTSPEMSPLQPPPAADLQLAAEAFVRYCATPEELDALLQQAPQEEGAYVPLWDEEAYEPQHEPRRRDIWAEELAADERRLAARAEEQKLAQLQRVTQSVVECALQQDLIDELAQDLVRPKCALAVEAQLRLMEREPHFARRIKTANITIAPVETEDERDKIVDDVAAYLRLVAPHLRRLHLNIPEEMFELEDIRDALDTCHRLEKLTLAGVHTLSSADLLELIEALPSLHTLRFPKLDLVPCEVTDPSRVAETPYVNCDARKLTQREGIPFIRKLLGKSTDPRYTFGIQIFPKEKGPVPALELVTRKKEPRSRTASSM